MSSNLDSAFNLVINWWREGGFMLVMTPQIEEEIAIVLTRNYFFQLPELTDILRLSPKTSLSINWLN